MGINGLWGVQWEEWRDSGRTDGYRGECYLVTGEQAQSTIDVTALLRDYIL